MALFPLLPFLSRSQRGNCKHPWNRNSNCRRDGSCKESSFFFFLQDIYYMSFLTTQSHILLMQKLFPIPTSDNQDICFGTQKIVRAAREKRDIISAEMNSQSYSRNVTHTKSHASPTTIGIKKPSSDWRLQRPLALNLHQISSRMPFDDLFWQGFSTYFYDFTLVY